VAADASDRRQALVQQRELQAADAELEGLRKRGDLLQVRAPVSGLVTGDAASLRPGQWVGRETLLFQIVDQAGLRIVGLLPERESRRLFKGAAVRFVAADGVHGRVDGTLTGLGLPGGEGQALPYLAAQYGGDVVIETRRDGPSATGYLTMFAVTGAAVPGRAITGTAVVTAEPESLFGFLAKRVVMVFLRESGF
jgi:HlyD family secretion protein